MKWIPNSPAARIGIFSGILLSLILGVFAGVVFLGAPLLGFSSDLNINLRSGSFLALLFLATFAATTITMILLSRQFVDRPIEELIHLMNNASSSDFLLRAPVDSGHVLGRLSQSFNRLLEKITSLDAFQIDTERQLLLTQQELEHKKALEEKNQIIAATNEELKTRLSELSLLYDFSLEISSQLEMGKIYLTVEKFLGDRMKFKEFSLLIYEDEKKELVITVARGFDHEENIRGMVFHGGEGITGQVLLKKETTYVPDTRLEPNYLHYKGEKGEDGSFLSLPLLFRKKVTGVLNLSRPGINQFTEGEIRFLNTLAAELAIALNNAKLYAQKLEMAVRDDLTSLHNRRHFQETLLLEIKRVKRFGGPLTLLMIDIDYFKKINDQFGHLVGDEVLKELAQLLPHQLREVDFVARFGGEEFVVILPGTSKDDGIQVAEKIRQHLETHPYASLPASLHLTVSLGVASYSEKLFSLETLLQATDSALYAAKKRGRNCVAVSEEFASA